MVPRYSSDFGAGVTYDLPSAVRTVRLGVTSLPLHSCMFGGQVTALQCA